MSLSACQLYEFGPFRLDPPERLLLREGQPVALPPKAYDLLVALVTHAGHLVTKEDLLREVWPGTFVEEANLSYTVSLLRKALGDDTEPYRYIETVPKRGYRFREPIAATEPNPNATSDRRLTAGGFPLMGMSRGRRVAAAVALVSALGALIVWQVGTDGNDGTETRREIRSVAILPLKNFSKDPAQDYFVEGMHEALITELARAGSLSVVGRSSAMRYAGKDLPPGEVARELNVQALVEGSVVRVGEQVRISVQLLDAGSGRTLWAAAFHRNLGDVLALQTDVAQAIATELQSATRERTTPRSTARRVNAETYELYLRGRHHFNRRGEADLSKAIAHFSNAIARDPEYAAAYAGLADSHNLMPAYGSTAPRDAVPHGKAAALSAVALDDGGAEGHASLAWALLSYDWDWAAADREFQRAIALDPMYPIARLWYGLAMTWRGRFEEGAAEMQRGRELDPVSPVMLQNVAAVYYFARDYDRAIRETDGLIQLDDTYAEAHVWQGLAQLQKGLREEAIQSLERAVALSPDRSTLIARLAYGYGVTGQTQAALARLATLTNKSREKYVSAVNFATVYVGLGDKEKALGWLEKGLDERATEMLFLKTDARFDPLRSEPRFQRVLERMNFPN